MSTISLDIAQELRRKAQELLDQAAALESGQCSGVSASWCPIHGDCLCPYPEDEKSDEDCPLHSSLSTHAERFLQAIKHGTETEYVPIS